MKSLPSRRIGRKNYRKLISLLHTFCFCQIFLFFNFFNQMYRVIKDKGEENGERGYGPCFLNHAVLVVSKHRYPLDRTSWSMKIIWLKILNSRIISIFNQIIFLLHDVWSRGYPCIQDTYNENINFKCMN